MTRAKTLGWLIALGAGALASASAQQAAVVAIEAGKVLTMTGMGMGHDMKPAKHRMTTTLHGKDKHVFEMYVTGSDGQEMKTMTITYTRRAPKLDKVKKPR